MELCKYKNLIDFIHEHGRVGVNLARHWFRQVVDALNYIHIEHRMAYGDVKLESVTIADSGTVKLIDCVFAYFVSANIADIYSDDVKRDEICGTACYFSPLINAREPYNPFKRINRFPFYWLEREECLRQQWDYPDHIQALFPADMSPTERHLSRRGNAQSGTE